VSSDKTIGNDNHSLARRGGAGPFLRWPGGKRWLMPIIEKSVDVGRLRECYVEPFLGGGSFFFYFELSPCILSDINGDLINAYVQVRDQSEELIDALKLLPVDRQTYERMRGPIPRSDFDRAVRFLYLNRTAFSGIYRLNRKGEFNVPFGRGERTPELLWRTDILRDAAKALQGVELRVADFEGVIASAPEGSLIYCDPTYSVKGLWEEGGFVRYNSRVFSWRDQERLARACRKAASQGSTLLISNAYNSDVAQLYEGAERYVLDRHSRLAADVGSRGARSEYLFVIRPG
jgi:DNA adenine methylase